LEGFLKSFVQVENFHLTIPTKSLMKILKILIYNVTFVIPMVKSIQIQKSLNFNLTLQTTSPMKILKILIFNVLLVISLVTLNYKTRIKTNETWSSSFFSSLSHSQPKSSIIFSSYPQVCCLFSFFFLLFLGLLTILFFVF
jgi:hypothetical protein